jgi:hypothetical protein
MSATPHLAVFLDRDNKMAIHLDDHRRFCEGLITLAAPFGAVVATQVRRALLDGRPVSGNPADVIAYFGTELSAVQATIRPLVEALTDMLPGFDTWLVASGFGNDRLFMSAMLTWARVLAAMPRPTGKDRARILQSIVSVPRMVCP